MTEAEFQGQVIDLARMFGWLVYHARPVKLPSGKTATPGKGDVTGFPDLVLARDGVAVLAELKTDIGRVSAAQRAWIDTSGAYLWRPADWEEIEAFLRKDMKHAAS